MVATVFSNIAIGLEVLLLFNLMILVHELGHFLAARWRGLVVEKFALWFGKPLWSKTIGGVEYRLGWIPAGGFVAVPQLAPMEALEGKNKGDATLLPPAAPLDKMIVALAGPIFSLLLAFLFACFVWFFGRPVSESERTAVIGYVLPGGPAAKAGLQPGDHLLSVNGHPVTRIQGMGTMSDTVAWNVAISQSARIPIVFQRDGVKKTIEVEPSIQPHEGWGRKHLRQLQLLPAQTPLIAQVAPRSPAAVAGLRTGDFVIAANGSKLWSPLSLVEILKKQPNQPVVLTIHRKLNEDSSQSFLVTLLPQVPLGGQEPRLGIYWDERGSLTLVHPEPFSQLLASVRTIGETLSALLRPHSAIAIEHLSGPLGIMRVYYLLFESPMGWRLALWFSVVLNVNLALLNLLPLPVLDGGHVLLSFIEMILKRPLEHRFLEWIQNGCAALLFGFMLYVSFFDILDLPWARWKKNPTVPSQPLQFAPSSSTSAFSLEKK